MKNSYLFWYSKNIQKISVLILSKIVQVIDSVYHQKLFQPHKLVFIDNEVIKQEKIKMIFLYS